MVEIVFDPILFILFDQFRTSFLRNRELMPWFVRYQFRKSRVLDAVGINEKVREFLAICRSLRFRGSLWVIVGFGRVVASYTESAS